MNIDKINLLGKNPKLRDENIIQQNDILFIKPKGKDLLAFYEILIILLYSKN